MESLPLAFSSGWASGVNAYLVVLVLGVADRISDRSDIPDVLARWDVLAIAGFLYAMEFVADKIPYVDSTWDFVSTAIRPTAGAVIGALTLTLAGSLLSFLRISPDWQIGAQGAILIAVLALRALVNQTERRAA